MHSAVGQLFTYPSLMYLHFSLRESRLAKMSDSDEYHLVKSNIMLEQLDCIIFVVGAARSGTTWVFDIFANHPQIAGAKETWLFTRENGVAGLFSDAHYPPRHSGLGQYVPREDMIAYTRAFATQLLSHPMKAQHRFLVEKSPSHAYSLELIYELFPTSKFVNVIRDGRDVSVSVRAASRSWAKQWRKSFGKSIRHSASSWKQSIRSVRRQIEQLGIKDQYIEIRYEDLIQDPYEGYKKLYDHCGIPYDQKILDDVFAATDFGNNYRRSNRNFRRHGRTGDWHRQFTPWNALFFNAVAGDMLIQLGYEKNRFWFPNPIRWLDVR